MKKLLFGEKKPRKHTCTKDGITDQAWQLNEQPKATIPAPSSSPRTLVLPRFDVSLPGSRIFVLDNFLTQADCEYFIKQSKKIGYSSLTPEFQEEYRNNKR